ncbi:MAG TPA: hypothetical protein VGR03_14925 [Candidatus Acidoferrum sp.]|nr:hypothetical protein [Candidatus Acidoferrum sp.]
MRETVLRDFLLGRVTATALARDILGSTKRVEPIKFLVEIEDMDEEFWISREMLVSLCEAVLSAELPPQELSTIGFALVASGKFAWDAEDLCGHVIHDWSCPEVNYPLTIENVQRFKNWLLELEPYPAKPQLGPPTKNECLISITEKKSLPRQQRG